MKVDETDPTIAIVTLEDPNALGALKAGMEDHRQWSRHPETNELAQYIQDNRKFTNIAVKTGETYIRIK